VLSLLLLVINDNVFKGASWFPAYLAGKLSDFAGLFFFPLLVVAMLAVVWPHWSTQPRVVWTAALATLVAFSLIQVHPGSAHVYVNVLSILRVPVEALRSLLVEGNVVWERPSLNHVMDPSDIVAAPAALLSARWALGRLRLADDVGGAHSGSGSSNVLQSSPATRASAIAPYNNVAATASR
jgi:hypothetical protein